jgi:hypothetical protein
MRTVAAVQTGLFSGEGGGAAPLRILGDRDQRVNLLLTGSLLPVLTITE